MSTSLFIAIGIWTIVSNNDAAIAEHKAKTPAATALIARAPALLREADQVVAQALAAGHSIPAQPIFGGKIDAIAAQADKDFGLGAFGRPLTVCANIAANLQSYYDARFGSDVKFTAQLRRDIDKAVRLCREAVRTPPTPEITITGPKNGNPPAACFEILVLGASAAKQSTWICPKHTKL